MMLKKNDDLFLDQVDADIRQKHELEINNKQMSAKKLTLMLGIVLLLMIFSVGAISDWFQVNPFAAFADASIYWLAATLVIVALAILLDALVMKVYVNVFKRDYTFKQAIKITMIGRFFNGVTPAASGGQFVQLFVFKKQGVKSKDAVAILMLRFITSQSVLVILSLTLFALRFNLYVHDLKLELMVGLAAAGFISNTVVLVSLFLVTYSKRVHGLLVKVYGFFYGKIRRKPEKVKEKVIALEEKVSEIRAGANILIKKKRVLVSSFLTMTAASFLVYWSAQFAGLAVGAPYEIDWGNFYKIIDISTLSMFIGTMNSLVPIPGASGTTELSFGEVFKAYLLYIQPNLSLETIKQIISAQTIVWRLANFTIPLIMGLVVYLYSRDGIGIRTRKYDDASVIVKE